MMSYEIDLEDSPMRYRLAADVNLRDFCGQVVKLQEIMDRNGNSIILIIGEDHQALTLAYEVKTRARPAVSSHMQPDSKIN